MAIDRDAERVSAINQLTGLRVLFPNGSIDQDTRQASCRTCLSVLAIPPIVHLDCAITLSPYINATIENNVYIDAAITSKPYIDGVPGMNN